MYVNIGAYPARDRDEPHQCMTRHGTNMTSTQGLSVNVRQLSHQGVAGTPELILEHHASNTLSTADVT